MIKFGVTSCVVTKCWLFSQTSMSKILSSKLHFAFIYHTFIHITYNYKNIIAWQEIRQALLSFLC